MTKVVGVLKFQILCETIILKIFQYLECPSSEYPHTPHKLVTERALQLKLQDWCRGPELPVNM